MIIAASGSLREYHASINSLLWHLLALSSVLTLSNCKLYLSQCTYGKIFEFKSKVRSFMFGDPRGG